VSGSCASMPARGGLSGLGGADVQSLLARLEPRVQEAQDLAGAAMLATVEQIACRWYEEVAAIERAWTAYETAVADGERTRTALVATLRTLIELVGSSSRGGDRGLDPPAAAVAGGRLTAAHRVPAVTLDQCADLTLPADARSAELAACLLGPFRLLHRGQSLDEWHGPKTPRVLRYLVAQRGRSVPRDVLIELFWPDADAECGRRNLHQTIYTIRKTLRDAQSGHDGSEYSHIVFENDAYALNVEAGFWCDATEFEDHVAAGRKAESEGRNDDAAVHYGHAQHLYRGEFLEDLPYDDWVQADRRHLRMLYIETVNRLAESRLDAGDVDEALELSQRLLSCDPCDESAHRRAMRCYASSGNRGRLTQQYEACADAMKRVLGMDPDPETVELYASLVNRS
jgi:DNA-binding SARP family transcriptional activator